MQIKLTVKDGPHKGKAFTFAGHDTFLVGRSKHAHFRLSAKDRYFSRIHFMVEVNAPRCRLLDMGSRNGTYVNGKKMAKADLKPGDKIKAGRTVLLVSMKKSKVASVPVAKPFRPPPQKRQGDKEKERQGDRQADIPLSLSPGLFVSRSASGSPAPSSSLPATVKWCQACRAPVSPDAGGNIAWLCPACQEKIRNHSQFIPGYQIIQEIGRGSMGIVYQSIRQDDGTVVALKTVTPAVTPSPADLGRFQREASILYELDHPNIVAFRDMGEANGVIYFAMDYVLGTDARQLLKKHGRMSVRRAVVLICQLLQALDYAHAKGFVHRDIKPSNLMVKEEEDREVALLTDFGLARVYQASKLSGLTLLGDIGGTVPFMAPEQITDFRNVKPPADQFATGATLYTLLTGRFIHDFPRQDEKRLLMILHDEPVPIRDRRSDIPKELAEIIHRTLEKDPNDRYDDVKVLRRALLKFCK
jgi:serine/threonine-protein kinase